MEFRPEIISVMALKLLICMHISATLMKRSMTSTRAWYSRLKTTYVLTQLLTLLKRSIMTKM